MPNEKSVFAQNEEEILKMWEDNNIFQKTLEKKSPKGNFVFFEGPPTANGRPGIHHVLARAFKDVVPRFRTMQGYHVERKAGWDTHGLPVELQIEKKLGISGKPEIEKFGIEEFNKQCKQSVWEYKDEWEKLTRRIGFWLDLGHAYVTYDNNYIESLWWIFKQIYDKGLVYKGYKVVPHCPRCGTALSSHEVAQGYKSVKENSLYVKFKVKGQDDTYILSWTTTPWTLPGNVALAVGKNIDYVKVKYHDEFFILAEDLVKEVFEEPVEIVEEFLGEKILGWEYEPLFPGGVDPGDKKAWFVGKADFVSTVDGTGVVHTAAMYGEDDFNFGVAYDLPLKHTVDEAGKFLPSVTKWAGKFVKNKEVEQGIIEDLQSRNLLFKEKQYEHDYPFCWRCDSPLLYYAKDSWFIKVSKVQADLKKNNEKINWVPDYIKHGRFGEWLEGIKDWAISRQRYWGTPIPIWECGSCKKIEVLGSLQELEKKAGSLPKNKDGELDVHRPFIDALTYHCSCGGTMQRVKDVFDCWYDSGAMPFAQHHYPFENKELVDKGIQFPADYISEAIDQTRGWFYTLLAISTLLGKGAPYKNVICLGHIRDKNGQKMSKSRGNVVDPWMIADKFGIDALRMHFYSINQPGDSKNFDEKDVQEILRKVIMLLSNIVSFYKLHKDDGTVYEIPKATNILDKWVISKTNSLIKEITKKLESCDIFESARALIVFIDELSTWYVRRSRERLKIEGRDKEDCLKTLHYVLHNLLRLLAPFAPFISERFYLELFGGCKSVHLEVWPEAHEKLIDKDILAQMEMAKRIVEMGLALRAEKGTKVRQVLGSLAVFGIKLSSELQKIVAEELNVKEIKGDVGLDDRWAIKEDGGLQVALNIEITDELRKEGLIREIVRTINQLRKNQNLTIKNRVKVFYKTDDEMLNGVLKDHADKIKTGVLADELIEGDGEDVVLDGKTIKLKVEAV